MPDKIDPPALDPVEIEPRIGPSYPAQFAGPVEGRQKRALGDPLGLTQFGVSLVTLPPGCWSSLRLEGRQKRALGDPLGLTQFGVNLVTLPPGCWSSLRHWHTAEDEFVYVVSGEISLVTETGGQRLQPGMATGFPAGKADGHHLINKGPTDATYLEVGTREVEGDKVDYPDIDMMLESSKRPLRFTNRRGEPY